MNIIIYKIENGFIGTSQTTVSGTNIYTPQNKEKILPGFNQIPTIRLEKYARNNVLLPIKMAHIL